MRRQYALQIKYNYYFCLLILAVICNPAYSQQDQDNAFVYPIKKDWSTAKDMKEATYFMQLIHENDSTYVCRYYNKFGSMVRQESYLDSMLIIPNGRFCWYDQKGMLDSTGLVYRRRKTGAWNYYDDNGDLAFSLIYNNGRMVEGRNLLKKKWTDEKGVNTLLSTKQSNEPDNNDTGDSARKIPFFKQVSFGERDSAEKHWNDYLTDHITLPGRFISIYGVDGCTVVASFTVNNKGRTEDIYLIHSCEWSADNEVLHVLGNSPVWSITDQYEDSAEHSLQQAVTFQPYGIMNNDSVRKGNVYIGSHGIQVPPKFPGGAEAWQHFLAKNLKSDVALFNHAPDGHYTIVASYLIQEDGTVAEIEALNNPGYGTAEEFIRVLKKSPKWIPAMQDGKPMAYRVKQAVTFTVESGN